jgi:hypothetical protein
MPGARDDRGRESIQADNWRTHKLVTGMAAFTMIILEMLKETSKSKGESNAKAITRAD